MTPHDQTAISYTFSSSPPRWQLIPGHMQDAVAGYIERGELSSGFLKAFVENDLKATFREADSINAGRIANYVTFFYNYAPGVCWGSPDSVRGWVTIGGLHGLRAAEAADLLQAAQ